MECAIGVCSSGLRVTLDVGKRRGAMARAAAVNPRCRADSRSLLESICDLLINDVGSVGLADCSRTIYDG